MVSEFGGKRVPGLTCAENWVFIPRVLVGAGKATFIKLFLLCWRLKVMQLPIDFTQHHVVLLVVIRIISQWRMFSPHLFFFG